MHQSNLSSLESVHWNTSLPAMHQSNLSSLESVHWNTSLPPMHQSNPSIALKLSTYYPFWGRLYSYGGEKKQNKSKTNNQSNSWKTTRVPMKIWPSVVQGGANVTCHSMFNTSPSESRDFSPRCIKPSVTYLLKPRVLATTANIIPDLRFFWQWL
jgi:hypothetical protein